MPPGMVSRCQKLAQCQVEPPGLTKPPSLKVSAARGGPSGESSPAPPRAPRAPRAPLLALPEAPSGHRALAGAIGRFDEMQPLKFD